ncbi:MAG: hypothetical protein ACRDH9_09820 [Actinomycetota bacterium]
MRARTVMLALTGVILVVMPARASHADWHVGLDEDSVDAGVGVGGGGGSDSVGGGNGYTYVWTLDTCTPGGDPHVGDSFWVLVLDSAGNVVGEFCADPNAAAPPTPPTAAEILNQAPLPRCEIKVNPREDGLTGVETWLWCERVEDVTVTAAIRGYEVQATATPTQFRWLPGDGASYVSTNPGTEEDPSARHMYETRGDYVIAVDVAWSGTYTYEGHGVAESGSLDGVTVDSDRGYHVIESRGVLTG